MGKRRKVPEDLMGTILREGAGTSGSERIPAGSLGSSDAGPGTTPPAPASGSTISWEEQPELVGTTFNLSKQVNRELDRLRLELQPVEDIHSSNSEIAEMALQIAIEDARERGRESELLKRLSGRTADQAEKATAGAPDEAADELGQKVRRSVDVSGRIVETVFNEDGKIVDEEEVGNVADLPVEAEYVYGEGRLRNVATDELGNTFEWVTDETFSTIEARILQGTD